MKEKRMGQILLLTSLGLSFAAPALALADFDLGVYEVGEQAKRIFEGLEIPAKNLTDIGESKAHQRFKIGKNIYCVESTEYTTGHRSYFCTVGLNKTGEAATSD
jgi:hypothetical protein